MVEVPAVATSTWIEWRRLPLSEARRSWNGERVGLVSDLRCECARTSCRDTVPAVAATHRCLPDYFIVSPAHLDGNAVVRAADRFFVVESRRSASRNSTGKMA